MLMKIKKLFYLWAYIDYEHTGSKEETYFWKHAKEIGSKNIRMIRSVSFIFLLICAFVIVSTFTYFINYDLRLLYILIFILQLIIYSSCSWLMKQAVSPLAAYLITSLYIVQMLCISGYIGVVFSRFESATVYVAILVISSMIFTIPPLLSACLAILSTALMLLASYFTKEIGWFLSDVINCCGVLILSLLSGWQVNKIRAEEASARMRVLKLNAQLKHISVSDQLTGLANHRSFQDTYYTMFEVAKRCKQRIGIIMIDVDNFKFYNDNYGHVEGDRCLQAIANVFLKFANEGIKIYRYGGEEFIILLEEADCDRPVEIAERVKNAIEALAIPHAFSDVAKIVTLSMGVYVNHPHILNKPMCFINQADQAMYASKKQGRNQILADIQ